MSQISDDRAPVNPAPFEPTADDLADYGAWSREREARLMAGRVAAVPTFRERLLAVAHDLSDDPDDVVAWVGEQVGNIYDLACHLEATSPGAYEDRLAAMRDALG